MIALFRDFIRTLTNAAQIFVVILLVFVPFFVTYDAFTSGMTIYGQGYWEEACMEEEIFQFRHIIKLQKQLTSIPVFSVSKGK